MVMMGFGKDVAPVRRAGRTGGPTKGKERGGREISGLNRSNELGRTSLFVARIEEDYPEEGEFLVRVHARADLIDGGGFPRLKVALGFRADTRTPVPTERPETSGPSASIRPASSLPGLAGSGGIHW